MTMDSRTVNPCPSDLPKGVKSRASGRVSLVNPQASFLDAAPATLARARPIRVSSLFSPTCIRRMLSSLRFDPFRQLTSRPPKRAQMPSNSEDDPAEGAVLDQVTKGIGRLSQREGLRDDRLDFAGCQKLGDGFPGILASRGRLRKQTETFDRGPFPDKMRHIDGCCAPG